MTRKQSICAEAIAAFEKKKKEKAKRLY